MSLTDEMLKRRKTQMSTLSDIENREIIRLEKEAEEHRHRQFLDAQMRHHEDGKQDLGNAVSSLASRYAFSNRLVKGANTEVIIQSSQLLFYKNVFSAVVAALEARDAYTSHHSERVTIMAERFCKILMLPLMHTQVVTVTASVHDIGKLGISDATLKKPSSLDDDEWDEMKTHSYMGADIIQKAGPNLEFIAAGILAHHEKWDGTGYPKGLKGEEIPYTSRIVSICDSTDAMLSSRCYRSHMSKAYCKSQLELNKGKMYQPELVDLFLAHWDEILEGLFDEIE